MYSNGQRWISAEYRENIESTKNNGNTCIYIILMIIMLMNDFYNAVVL